jgi:hypothetical protein
MKGGVTLMDAIKQAIESFLGQLFPILLDFLSRLFAWIPSTFA